ncbi:MAG: leucine-rich repeat domain-containing protein, partial [Clostridiales bacterium]|nr:leucine-rich repeat domain-containing protein [Clostridiales bacterium]
PVASYDGYDFVESDDNWYLVRYPEEEEELVLPAAVETEEHSFSEYSVYNRLFSENGLLTSVYIPSNAKRIGERAFSDCDNLISVTVENGVTTIGSGAFSGCTELKTFVFPNSVTTVADGLFRDCAELERVTLPAAVDRIGSNAFNKCVSLEKLSIPNDCTEICVGAFGGCIMLYDVNIPSACEQIGIGAFANCRRIKSVTLPTTLKSNGIGVGAFEGCIKLYEVYNLSNLKVLYGSESNGSVGKYAYAVHENAEDLPLDNTIVGGLHYYKLDEQWYLVDYYGADGVVKVSGFTFGGERIDNIIIIDYAFQYYDTIISVAIDETVSLIGKSAFNACSELNSVEISTDKLGISDGAFAECEKLTSLTVFSGDVDFGTEAFMLCGLTSVLLVGGDFVIRDDVFYDNTELDALTVDCKSLTVNEMAFFNGLKAAEIKCSSSFTAKYRAFFGSSISELAVEADDVDILAQNYVGYNITEVGIVGNKSVHLASSAFNACGSIISFVLRGKTVSIDGTAFNACSNPYTQSGMGDLSVTGEQIDISTSAFSHCIVNSLTIDGAALTLGDGAVDKAIFLGSAIGELSIVYGGESITVGELLNDSTLSALNVRGKKVEIADNAFHTEGKLASLGVAAEELTIGTYAFCNQQERKSVVLTAARAAEICESAF